MRVASTAIALLTCAFLVVGCAREHGPRGQAPVRTMDVSRLTLPEVAADGRATDFALRARPGHVLVVLFGYANCPDVCPTTLADLARARTRLGPDGDRVDVAFITVDPARDSAAALAPWLAAFVPGGHALRPSTQAQLGLAQASFGAISRVTRDTQGRVEVSHTAMTYAVDPSGQVRLQWDFGTTPAAFERDLRRLLGALREASR
jgi:protein SCO1